MTILVLVMKIYSMSIIQRVRNYLKARGKPVSREEILRVAGKVEGVDLDEVNKAISSLQYLNDPKDCNIGSWWGYKKNGRPDVGEQQTLWFCWYDMTDNEKKEWADKMEWFDGLE